LRISSAAMSEIRNGQSEICNSQTVKLFVRHCTNDPCINWLPRCRIARQGGDWAPRRGAGKLAGGNTPGPCVPHSPTHPGGVRGSAPKGRSRHPSGVPKIPSRSTCRCELGREFTERRGQGSCFDGISGNPYEYKSVWCRRESAGVAEVPFKEPLNGAIGDSAGTVNRYGQRLAHASREFMLAGSNFS